MERPQSLAEFLGTAPDQGEARPRLEDIASDAKGFCEAVLNSFEFRQYIVHGLTLGSIPSAVMLRVMDMAGWQKPPERIEHTGANGKPIETITEVRRVIVHAQPTPVEEPATETHVIH